MHQALTDGFVDTSTPAVVVGVAFVALVAAIVMCVAARRRCSRSHELQRRAVAGDWGTIGAVARAPSRALELCAALPPAFVLVATLGVVEHSRATILRVALAPSRAAHMDQLLAQTVQSALLAAGFGLMGTVLALLPACAAFGLAATGRRRIAGLLQGASMLEREPAEARAFAAFPGPRAAPFVGSVTAFSFLSFGPIAISGIIASFEVFERWVELGSLDPSARLQSFNAALGAGRTMLERGFTWSVVGTAVAALATGTVAWLASSRRSRARMLGSAAATPDARCAVARGVVALVLAALFVALAEPMRREAALEWPVGTRRGLDLSLVTPKLQGPDPVGFGPLVEVGRDSLAVNGMTSDAEELRGRLDALRRDFSVLHAREAFTGSILIACESEVGAERIAWLLATVARSGYRAPTFVFDIPHVSERPVLGPVELRRPSGARATWVDSWRAADSGTALIRVAESSSCAALAERIVSARRRDQEVALLAPYQPRHE